MYQNYEEFKSLDWEKIKIPKIINISILSLIVISILVGQYFVSLIELLKLIKKMPLLILVIPLLILLYLVLHELIHGILMKYFSGISPQYGFSGPFIFAKSEAVFDKYAYILITLAPMLILGIISVVLSFIIPGTGIWLTIFVWIINLYASRGDLQAIILLKGLPRSYGIKDDGDSIQIYKPIQ
ncbi:DUF3267 domain-containing protein [Pseudogracilibacillus sp. SE30717A]|uniref:DUF3267 domain-containing protein n=1 Tax=Pseudogracilibacillus sp. SE30717A TaxID=3098293 RepID=UPI00300DC830